MMTLVIVLVCNATTDPIEYQHFLNLSSISTTISGKMGNILYVLIFIFYFFNINMIEASENKYSRIINAMTCICNAQKTLKKFTIWNEKFQSCSCKSDFDPCEYRYYNK